MHGRKKQGAFKQEMHYETAAEIEAKFNGVDDGSYWVGLGFSDDGVHAMGEDSVIACLATLWPIIGTQFHLQVCR